MRHVRFVLLLLVALCIALLPAVVWAMNECQLNTQPAAVDACFRNAERGRLIYDGTLVAAVILAIGLHIARSKWVPLGLVVLAVAPWLTMFA